MADLTMLVVGCPGRCGRPATRAELICLSCQLDLPVELAQAVEIGRNRMREAALDYSATMLLAIEWFDKHHPIPPTGPNPDAKHTPAELCDCPPPVPGRPYHCAKGQTPREAT